MFRIDTKISTLYKSIFKIDASISTTQKQHRLNVCILMLVSHKSTRLLSIVD